MTTNVQHKMGTLAIMNAHDQPSMTTARRITHDNH